MKIKFLTIAFLALTSANFAQDRTIVNANNSEVSDNLDLRAVASLFGDSQNLDDFERRLNDPKLMISNLDLNNDNQVDYLRVIESVEDRTHLIIIQSVLNQDVYQDVATVEVIKDNNNKIQVQVVGDVYMYGQNYIYEPIYVNTPVFYTNFWVTNYRPYCSNWRWNYYPTHFIAWNPFPIFRYRHNVGLCININYQYNYVNVRHGHIAYNNYYSRRCNGYEILHPNRSFEQRNSSYSNRYELERSRPKTRDIAYANNRNASRNESRSYENTRGNSSRNENNSIERTRDNSGNTTRNQSNTIERVRDNSTREESNSIERVRGNSGNTTRNESDSSERVRDNSTREESNSIEKVRGNSGNTTRNQSNSTERVRGNSGNSTRDENNNVERVRGNSGNNNRSESSSGNSRNNSGNENQSRKSAGSRR